MKERVKFKSIATILILVMVFEYISFLTPLLESSAENNLGLVEINSSEIDWTYDVVEENHELENFKPTDREQLKGKIFSIPNQMLINGETYNVVSIADYAFLKSYTSYITSESFIIKNIPNGIREIGKGAFNSCYIENFSIPSNIEKIGEDAFRYCKTVDLNDTFNTPLVYNVFYGCDNLESIGKNAFNNCNFIVSINLSESVKSIGKSAFKDCSSLKSINVNSDNARLNIDSNAFNGINTDAKFSIPYSTKIGSDETFIDNVFTKGNTVFCKDPSKIDTSLVETNNLNVANYLKRKTDHFGVDYIYNDWEETEIDGITWRYHLKNEEEAYGLNIDPNTSGELIEIPSMLMNAGLQKEIAVKGIGQKMYSGENIPVAVSNFNTVKVSEGIETIYNKAFSGCDNKIIIKDEKTNVVMDNGSNAFYNHGENLQVICSPLSSAYSSISSYNRDIENGNGNETRTKVNLLALIKFQNATLWQRVYNQVTNASYNNGNNVTFTVENGEYYLTEDELKKITTVDISNDENTDDSEKFDIDGIQDLEKLLYLEELNASYNKIDDFYEWMCKLKKLNLSHNLICSISLNDKYESKTINLEELDLSYNEIWDLSAWNSKFHQEMPCFSTNMKNLKKLNLSNNYIQSMGDTEYDINSREAFLNLKEAKTNNESSNTLEINLDNNQITNIETLNEILPGEEDNYQLSVSLKNQEIEIGGISEKKYSIDEYAPILKQVKFEKISGGENITFTTETCEIDGENIIISENLDSEHPAQIKINNGIMENSIIKLTIDDGIFVMYKQDDEKLYLNRAYTFANSRLSTEENGYFKYSVNDSDYQIYNSPIILKYGENKIKAKLFNKQLNINEKTVEDGNQLTVEANTEAIINYTTLKLNAIREDGLVYIYSNAQSLRYSFDENGNYTDYLNPIQNNSANKIYVKVNNEETVREISITNIASKDDYTIYDTHVGNDILFEDFQLETNHYHMQAARVEGKLYVYVKGSNKFAYSYDKRNWKIVDIENDVTTEYKKKIDEQTGNEVVLYSRTEVEDIGTDKIYLKYAEINDQGLWEEHLQVMYEKDIINLDYLEEIYGVVRESQKIYSFGQKRKAEEENEERVALINDEEKIREINEDIIAVSKIKDNKIILKSDGKVYKVSENNELNLIDQNLVNISQISEIYAVNNENKILKYDGNSYVQSNNFTVEETIKKISTVLVNGEKVPCVLYENGTVKILKLDGQTIELSNNAFDISSKDEKIYVLESDKVKTVVDYKDNLPVYSKDIEIVTLMQEDEKPLKINNTGSILTNKNNLYIGTKRDKILFQFLEDGNVLEKYLLDFESEDFGNTITAIARKLNNYKNNESYDENLIVNLSEDEKDELKQYLKYNVNGSTIGYIGFLNGLCEHLKISKSYTSDDFKNYLQQIDYDLFKVVIKNYEEVLDSYSEENVENDVKKLGDNTYQTSDNNIFYIMKRREIENEGMPTEYSGTPDATKVKQVIKPNNIYENIRANKLIEDVSVSKTEKLDENKVEINVQFPENKYTVKLPNGNNVTASTSFEVTENGEYGIEFTDEDGYKFIRVVHVENIQNRKQTKVPVVVAVNGKIKLESNEQIEYSIDEKENWSDYSEEITYQTPIYARIKNDNYECSILKITIDNSGKLEVYNEETREIRSEILTNAIGYKENIINSIGDETYQNIIKVAVTAAEVLKNTPETQNTDEFNFLTDISNLANNIIYSFSITDGKYAGCNFENNITEITYKDIDNNVVNIDMNNSIRQIAGTDENFDYGIISNQYGMAMEDSYITINNVEKQVKDLTEEEIENLTDDQIDKLTIDYYSYIHNYVYNGKVRILKKDKEKYAYINTNGELKTDIDVLNIAKGKIGENTKYVKIIGDGTTFYLLTQEGEVYFVSKILNNVYGYFNQRLYGKQLPIYWGYKYTYNAIENYDGIYKVEVNDVVDISDTLTAKTISGDIVSLLYPNIEDTTIVQELQKQTDKYLMNTKIGLKDGNVYNFNNINIKSNKFTGMDTDSFKVQNAKITLIPEKINGQIPQNAIGKYSNATNEVIPFEKDENNAITNGDLAEDEAYIAIDILEDSPEIIDIAELRDTYFAKVMQEMKYKVTDYRVVEGFNVDYAPEISNGMYTPAIAVDKDGEIYAYVLVGKVERSEDNEYPTDTRKGYLVDTGLNLDFFGPIANYILSNSNWTKQNVNLVLDGNTKNEIVEAEIKKNNEQISKLQKTDNEEISEKQVEIDKNGEYNYTIKDAKGRIYSGTLKVGNIDKLKPITPEITEESGKIKITFKDDQEATNDYAKSGIKIRQYKVNDGEWQTSSDNTVLLNVSVNDVVYAKSTDNAGNESNASRNKGEDSVSYTVKYLEKNTNKVLADEETVVNKRLNETYTETAKDVTGYTPEQISQEITVDVDGKILTFYYNANNYKIVFHAHYDGADPDKYEQTMTYDKSEELTENTFTREGYTFTKWNTDENENGISYNDKQVVKNLTSINNGIVDLYAQWNKNPEPEPETGKVIILYQDMEGKNVAESKMISGKVGKTYSTKSMKLEITGYEFVEVDGAEEGKFTKEDITVIYKYKKIEEPEPVPEPEIGKVAILYQDMEGKNVAESKMISGEVGKSYSTKSMKLEITGYEFVKVIGNEEGLFQQVNQFVIYQYKKIEEKGKVTVKYQDENGNSIKDDVILEGKVGEIYKTEKAEFDIYEFVEVEGAEEGKFTKEDQVVIYKYNKKTGRVIIIYNDPDGIKIKENDIVTGKIDTDYSLKRQVIDGYELVEIIGNEKGKFTLADQFVLYKYKKIETFDVVPQTGQSRIAYIAVGVIIIMSICGLIYIKWEDLKSKK